MSNTEKGIPGFEGYTATSTGIIYSYKKGKKYQMKYRDSPDGYYRVSLFKDDKRYSKLVHRLIASAWLDDSIDPLVNHIDSNKKNNNISNLEYASHKRNAQHAEENNLIHRKKQKVCKITLDGKLVAEYESISDAAKQENLKVSQICNVCKDKRRMIGGFVWKYKEDFIPDVAVRSITVKTKVVEQYSKTGEFIKKYDSIKEAATAVNISASNITATCTGKQPSAGGYKWKYTIIEDKPLKLEEWHDWLVHDNFPAYKISNDGRVYSIKHKKYLAVTPVSDGRIRYRLINKLGKSSAIFAHVLVAQLYISNPRNCPIINHINGSPGDNRVENLEWCTYSENTIHAHKVGLAKTKKAIIKMTLAEKEIKRYGSLKEAATELGITPQAISAACYGRTKTCHGFKWKFA